MPTPLPTPQMTSNLNIGAPAVPEVPGSAPAIPAPYQIAGKPLASLISYSKANPTSSIANLAKTYIQSGAYDSQALKEGTDLSWAGRPSLADMQESAKNPIQKVSDVDEKIQGVINDIGEKAGDKTVEQQQQGGKKIAASVENGPSITDDPATFAEKGGEAALGTASGAVQAVFAPITGIIQAISDKASDTNAMQDFAQGNKPTGGILDLMDNLNSKIREISAAHPEAAKNLSDAANVLLSVLGGEETGATGTDIGKTAADATETVKSDLTTKEPPDGGGGGSTPPSPEKPAPVIEKIPEKSGIPSRMKESVQPFAQDAGKFGIAQLFGMEAKDIPFIVQHPDLFSPEAMQKENINNLSDEVAGKVTEAKAKLDTPQTLAEDVQTAATNKIAKMTRNIPKIEDLGRQINDALQTRDQAIKEHASTYPTGPEKPPVKVDPNWLADNLEKVAGVKVGNNGDIDFSEPEAQRNAKINQETSPYGPKKLEDFYTVWQPAFANGELTRPEFIQFRQALGRLAKFNDGGFNQALDNVGKSLYSKFNTDYRPQISGLEAKDLEHSQMINDLARLQKGLATEDKFGNLQPQDTALSTIASATKDTKGEVAKRLEELVPGITKNLKKIEDTLTQATKLTSGLIDEKGNLKETAANKIAGASDTGKDEFARRLESLVPGIGKRITEMQQFKSEYGNLVDDAGNLKNNALHDIKNSVNPGNDLRLQKLEKLMPGIGTRIQQIKTIENINASMGTKTGTYVRAALGGGMMVAHPALGLAMLATLNPTVGLKILRSIGTMSGH